ncbi:MAG TPA: hypothetical protein VJJ20_01200 [Candidatus Paceibacterota bacterium]
MKAICTICSRNKQEGPELLPARLRYTASHIKAAEKIAGTLQLPYYILSGKYGLISADEMIPNYDYYLEQSKVDSLAQTIAGQLHKDAIVELDFYTEGKPSWAPYEAALRKGADLAGAALVVRAL